MTEDVQGGEAGHVTHQMLQQEQMYRFAEVIIAK